VIPGEPALCEGTIFHDRLVPRRHAFTYRISQVWLDPDRPQDLCDLHPAWSHRRPSPVRFRRCDYGSSDRGPAPYLSLGAEARNDLAPVLGRVPHGPVRLLTQLRRLGWLFNPISVFLVWEDGDGSTAGAGPVGAVLEVTNTPWKERTRYPIALVESDGRLCAEFDKAMHVSPFLGMDHRYRLRIADRDDIVAIDLDVLEPGGDIVVHTAMRLVRRPATRAALGAALRSLPLSTVTVSAGIHAQAARLWARRVPFVAHPRSSRKPADPATTRPSSDHPPSTGTRP
jgi:uncharacterized protein